MTGVPCSSGHADKTCATEPLRATRARPVPGSYHRRSQSLCAARASRSAALQGLVTTIGTETARKKSDERNGVTARPGTDVASAHRDRAGLIGVGTTIERRTAETAGWTNGERRGERPPGTPVARRVVPLCLELRWERSALRAVILCHPVHPVCCSAVSLIRPFRPFSVQSLFRPRPTFPVGMCPRRLTDRA